jgi:hypothetical protein
VSTGHSASNEANTSDSPASIDPSVTETIAARLGAIRPVRPEVVGRLRRELITGHYAPSAEAVADRLIGPLLSRPPRAIRWR